MSKMATTGLQLEDIKASQTGLDREGLATRAQSLTAPSPSTTPVSADQLGTAQAIKLPKPSTDTTQADGVVAGAEAGTKSTQDFIKELTPPETETSKGYNDLLGQINTLLPGMANKSADQLKAEKEQNIPKLKQDLAGLNAQITTRVAQYNKQVTGEGLASGETPLPVVMGRQAVIQRNQAADVGLLQARALGLQGQVEAAQETANRAIDLKYDTLKDTLDVKMEQLKLLQPILDKEERQQAAALERKYFEEDRKYTENKDKEKYNVGLAIDYGMKSKFTNRGGIVFRSGDGVEYSSIEEFFKDANVKSFQEAYDRGILADMPKLTTEQSLAQSNNVRDFNRDVLESDRAFKLDSNPLVDNEDGTRSIVNILDGSERKVSGNDYWGLYGNITGENGSSLWKYGLDVDLKTGDPVFSPTSGEVIDVVPESASGGFGNQVKIRTDSGEEIWLSHLDSGTVEKGQRVNAGDVVGVGGNTGNTIPGKGGDGSHLDFTVKDSKGKLMSAPQAKAWANQAYKSSQSSPVAITKDQRQRLQTEGLDEQTINAVMRDIATVGIDEALKEGSGLSPQQIKAFNEVLRGKTAEDSQEFLSKDYFRNILGEDALRKAAAEAGYKRGGGFFKNDDGVGEEGINDYLDYLEGIIAQYRSAGFTDKEIFKMMQEKK